MDDRAGFRLSNTRLLIEESRKRIAVWRVLKRHAETRTVAAREILQELRRVQSARKG